MFKNTLKDALIKAIAGNAKHNWTKHPTAYYAVNYLLDCVIANAANVFNEYKMRPNGEKAIAAEIIARTSSLSRITLNCLRQSPVVSSKLIEELTASAIAVKQGMLQDAQT